MAGLRGEAKKTAVKDEAARRSIFDKVCRVRRRIAFSNPLLSFKDIVFVKRQRSCFNHMCDQFYGIAYRPGGGVFVLSDAFGPNAKLRDLLAGSVVGKGRSQGRGARRRTKTKLGPDPRLLRRPPRRTDRRRLLSFSRRLLRRPDGGLCLRRVPRRTETPGAHRSAERPLGRRTLLSRLPGRPGRQGSRSIDRRDLERFPTVLDAQRPDRLHQRAARRILAVRAGLPDVHRVRHGRRRPRHPLPQLPRNERVAAERNRRRDGPLHAMGLRGPQRNDGPQSLDHDPRRPRPAGRARELRPAGRGRTWS